MALQLFKIASTTVETPQTSVTFSSIPQGYTDLIIKLSSRANNSGITIRFNGDSGANYSWKRLGGNGSVVNSDGNSTYGSPYNTFIYWAYSNQNTDTSNTFSNGDFYIPNYTSSNYKSASGDMVNENNATNAYAGLTAGLWSSSSAITSITMGIDTASPAYTAGTTATLYGVL